MAFSQSYRMIETVPPKSGGSPQDLNSTSTTQNYPLGQRVVGFDDVLGRAEFVYCKGVAATAKHDVVQINADFTTARAGTGTDKGPMGVAMAAIVADNYGWYCIKGRCEVTIAADAAAAAPCYINGAGVADDAVNAGDHIVGMAMEVALNVGGSAIVGTSETTAATTAIAYLNYPVCVRAV